MEKTLRRRAFRAALDAGLTPADAKIAARRFEAIVAKMLGNAKTLPRVIFEYDSQKNRIFLTHNGLWKGDVERALARFCEKKGIAEYRTSEREDLGHGWMRYTCKPARPAVDRHKQSKKTPEERILANAAGLSLEELEAIIAQLQGGQKV